MSEVVFTFDVQVEVEVEANISPWQHDTYNHAYGNWLPGDTSQITDLKVYQFIKGVRTEVTDDIELSELRKLKEKLIHLAVSEGA